MFMENKSLLELLMALPKNCTHAIVQGVELKLIDKQTKEKLLQNDPDGTKIHECTLSNGIFIFIKENGVLHTLYRVI